MLVDILAAFSAAENVPVAYRFFKKPQAPPFICYYEEASDNFVADNRNYLVKHRYIVELYTAYKMPELEAALEAALDKYVWTSEETYLDTEQMYEKIYELEE